MSYMQQGMQGGQMMAEGVPPQQYLLMVQANQLVPVNRKISATASSLEELEAILAAELNLQHMQIGVCVQDPASGQWYQVPSVQQMPPKAKVMVNPLQPRAAVGPTAEEMAQARERQLQFMMLKTQEENRIREEEMRMKEKEFEYQRSLAMLEARKRAAMGGQQQQMAAQVAPAPAPAGVGNAYVFMVVENDLVKNKQKVEVKAATLTMVEANLQSALKLRIDVSIFVGDALVSDISQLPAKGKIEVRPKQAPVAQVVQVAAAGKEYKLLVCENEMAAQNFKIKVVANSMEELEDAIAEKLGIEPNFAICPWDDDFDEFVDGIKWKDFPQTGKVELRPKADVGAEAAVAIAAAEARAAEAEARAIEGAEASKNQMATQMAESQAAQGADVEKMMQGMEARMAEAMAASEAKMRELEDQAKQREAEIAQKEQEAQERIKVMESRALEKTNTAAQDALAMAKKQIDDAKAAEAEAAAKRQEEQKAAADVEAAKAAEEAAAAEAAALGGQADIGAALEKLQSWMEKEIGKDGDKEVAALLDDFATATNPDVVEARNKLTSYRKSERERRKREFFAAKRAKEAGGGAAPAAATEAATEAARRAAAESAAKPEATAVTDEEAARKKAAAAMVSGQREAIQAAISEASGFDGLADDVVMLKQKLGEAAKAEVEAGLTSENDKKLSELVALAKEFNMDEVATTLEERKGELVKVKRMLAAAKRATDVEQVTEALTAARELKAFESQCKELEAAHGLGDPAAAAADGAGAEGGAAVETIPGEGDAAAATTYGEGGGDAEPPPSPKKVTATATKKVTATATKKKVTATATKKKVTATATAKKTGTAAVTAVRLTPTQLESYSCPIC